MIAYGLHIGTRVEMSTLGETNNAQFFSEPESCAFYRDRLFQREAVCTHAFVGMQPMRRHVPPSSGARSMHATLAPRCAARVAAM